LNASLNLWSVFSYVVGSRNTPTNSWLLLKVSTVFNVARNHGWRHTKNGTFSLFLGVFLKVITVIKFSASFELTKTYTRYSNYVAILPLLHFFHIVLLVIDNLDSELFHNSMLFLFLYIDSYFPKKATKEVPTLFLYEFYTGW